MDNTDPKEMWADTVPIAEYTPTDFQGRQQAFSVYDSTRQYRGLAEELGQRWGCDRSTAFDRCLRLYLGHLLDTCDTLDLRAEHDVNVLVPPRRWVEEHPEIVHEEIPMPEPNPVVDSDEQRIVPSTTVAVNEMVSTLVTEYDLHDSSSNFGKAAVCFVTRQSPLERDDIELINV
jgi:hypothetical protein